MSSMLRSSYYPNMKTAVSGLSQLKGKNIGFELDKWQSDISEGYDEYSSWMESTTVKTQYSSIASENSSECDELNGDWLSNFQSIKFGIRIFNHIILTFV